jgi:hypothetical protein
MLPENMKQYIGKHIVSGTFELDKESIMRFADAVGEKNPLYWYETEAQKAGYRSVVSPPGMMCTTWYLSRLDLTGMIGEASSHVDTWNYGYKRLLDGSTEILIHDMVCAGDMISFEQTVSDIDEKQGKNGRMLFIKYKVVFKRKNVPVETAYITLISLE